MFNKKVFTISRDTVGFGLHQINWYNDDVKEGSMLVTAGNLFPAQTLLIDADYRQVDYTYVQAAE